MAASGPESGGGHPNLSLTPPNGGATQGPLAPASKKLLQKNFRAFPASSLRDMEGRVGKHYPTLLRPKPFQALHLESGPGEPPVCRDLSFAVRGVDEVGVARRPAPAQRGGGGRERACAACMLTPIPLNSPSLERPHLPA